MLVRYVVHNVSVCVTLRYLNHNQLDRKEWPYYGLVPNDHDDHGQAMYATGCAYEFKTRLLQAHQGQHILMQEKHRASHVLR